MIVVAFLLFIVSMGWLGAVTHTRIVAVAGSGVVLLASYFIFGLCQIFRPVVLFLTAGGFEYRHPFHGAEHSWKDIEDVWLQKTRGMETVVWRLKLNSKPNLPRIPAKGAKFDGAVSPIFRKRRVEIAWRMINALDVHARASAQR
ncbi:hypothetical protein [Sphingomonas sp. RB1R13]|uniref:hypothetical protein n=1 Tax=Sphingomonas sp. RB1R13 TaxID=3096159 RepID=UPI002FC97F07